MKPTIRLIATAAALAAVAAIQTNCTPKVTAEQTTTVDAKPGVPGGKVTQVTELDATVTAINAAKREVTLVTRNNELFTVVAGPEVVNFPQIRVGDQLKVTYTEEMIVRMARRGEKLVDDGVADVKLAAEGKKPGLGIVTKNKAVATVSKIDPRSRKVTLRFADGTTQRLKVRDDIDLGKRRVGEHVVIETKDAYAIKMSRPR